MKVLFTILLSLSSLTVSASIFEKETQNCIIKEIFQQYGKYYGETTFGEFAVYARDVGNWEVIIFTTYRDNPQTGRSFLTLRNEDYRNSTLLIGEVIEKKLDISACF